MYLSKKIFVPTDVLISIDINWKYTFAQFGPQSPRLFVPNMWISLWINWLWKYLYVLENNCYVNDLSWFKIVFVCGFLENRLDFYLQETCIDEPKLNIEQPLKSNIVEFQATENCIRQPLYNVVLRKYKLIWNATLYAIEMHRFVTESIKFYKSQM